MLLPLYRPCSRRLVSVLVRHLISEQQQRLSRFHAYPVLDLNSLDPVRYPQTSINLSSGLCLKTRRKYEVMPEKLSFFLAEQIQRDFCHLDKLKEVAVLGRSNVGKSSLLNALLNTHLSVPSKTPGSTKKLYFAELDQGRGMLVDAPGYGYTKTSTDSKKKWRAMLEAYVSTSSRLSQVYLLVNLEHGLKDSDREVLSFLLGLSDVKVQLVLTKADRVSSLEEVVAQAASIGHQALQHDHHQQLHPFLHVVSAKTGWGVSPLKHGLWQALLHPPRSYDGREDQVLYRLLGYVPKAIGEEYKVGKYLKAQQQAQRQGLEGERQARKRLR